MISEGRHQKSAVASALKAAAKAGLAVTDDHSGHRWGRVTCPDCGGRFTVWSTPRNADNHAAQIARFTAKHVTHEKEVGSP